jgi:hypothetical protein
MFWMAKWIGAAVIACGLLSLSGCGGDSGSMAMNMPATPSSSGTSNPGATMLVDTFDSIQANVFTPLCAGCHGGSSPASNLDLDAAHSFDDLVGVPSTEQPSILRVKPFDPTDSYLIIHMQKEGDGAPASDIPVIAQWISDGAMPGMSMSAEVQVRATLPSDGDVVNSPPPRVIIGFTQELDPSSLTGASVRLERMADPSTPSAFMSTVPTVMTIPAGNARALVLTPASALASGTYQLVIETSAGSELRSQMGTVLPAGKRMVTRFRVTAAIDR